MKIENENLHFIVFFSEEEKQSGILEYLEENLSHYTFACSKDGSEWHIRNYERDKFTRLLNTYFQDKQMSLF